MVQEKEKQAEEVRQKKVSELALQTAKLEAEKAEKDAEEKAEREREDEKASLEAQRDQELEEMKVDPPSKHHQADWELWHAT